MSSVAMMTESNFFACLQRSQTCRRRGLPAMRCSGLPGKRVELQRAGIIPTALLICKIDNDVCRCSESFRDPICATTVGHFIEAGLNPNGANACVVPAFGVDLLVANKKRLRKIDIVITRRLQNHSRGRFAAF